MVDGVLETLGDVFSKNGSNDVKGIFPFFRICIRSEEFSLKKTYEIKNFKKKTLVLLSRRRIPFSFLNFHRNNPESGLRLVYFQLSL